MRLKERNAIRLWSAHGSAFIAICAVSASVSILRMGPKPNGPKNPDDENIGCIESITKLTVQPNPVIVENEADSSGTSTNYRWHRLLFLASEGKGKPPDLYLAETLKNHDGKIAAIRNVKNVTNSQVGDDHLLYVLPPFAIVATRALGQERSLAIFDLNGKPLPKSEEWSPVTRLLARFSDLSETGSFRGLGKMTARFVYPPQKLDMSVVDDKGKKVALVQWADRDNTLHKARIDLAKGVSSDKDLIVSLQTRLPKHPILWLVDTIRSVSWIGPGPIEWLEGRFFSLSDAYRRLHYRVTGKDRALEKLETRFAATHRALGLPKGLEVGKESRPVEWPPKPIPPPVFGNLNAREGQWYPDGPDFLRSLPGAPPPLVYRSYIRPDKERPYVTVHLFAMDMRQMEMHMVAGQEDPKPTTGSGGTGQIPRRADLMKRVVLVFNGAFKTEHGAYGMMVEKNVLVPPKEQAATLATFKNGTTAMGSWPKGAPIPEEMVSFRQNMDPLVENGVINPRRRYLWGFTLSDDITQMNTIRSGIGMTESGTLIYAWGEDLTAKTLGIAMNAAGCVYAMHLDMNPYHTALIYYRFEDDVDLQRPEFKAELAMPEMLYSPNRYVYGAPRDFFFLALKDTSLGPQWNAQRLAQPAPAFVPRVFKRELGQSILIAIDMSYALAEIAPGKIPNQLAPHLQSEAENDKLDDILVSVQLGAWSADRGQMVDRTVVAELSKGRPTLFVEKNGSLKMESWPLDGEDLISVEDAIQLGWLLRDGEPAASENDNSVVAIGRSGDRWLIIGQGNAKEISRAFLDLNIKNALSRPIGRGEIGLAIRGEKGMTDPWGKAIETLDTNTSSIRVHAKPGLSRMTRLDDALLSATQSDEISVDETVRNSRTQY